jgi:thioredoxin 1
MSATHIDDTTFAAEVDRATGVSVVDFWAPWCAPCRILGPSIEQLAGEYEGRAKVAKLNVDESPETARRFGVRSIPSVLFFRDGELVDTVVGLVPRSDLAARIDRYLEVAEESV